MNILLETERFFLRRFTDDDAQNLFELDNDADVMRYINGGTPTSFEVIQNELLPSFVRYDERFPQFGFFAITLKATSDERTMNALPVNGRRSGFLGWVSLRPVEENQNDALLGYRLHKAAWGKGYATEAARALINHGFAGTPIERVVATTYEENMGSRRVMEKLGMTLVRRFRITTNDLVSTDTYHPSTLDLWDGDDLDYALTRMEWASNR